MMFWELSGLFSLNTILPCPPVENVETGGVQAEHQQLTGLVGDVPSSLTTKLLSLRLHQKLRNQILAENMKLVVFSSSSSSTTVGRTVAIN